MIPNRDGFHETFINKLADASVLSVFQNGNYFRLQCDAGVHSTTAAPKIKMNNWGILAPSF